MTTAGMTPETRDRLRTLYDQLWSKSIHRIRTGNVEIDPVLEAKLPDGRRGLTLFARPGLEVRKTVGKFLEYLREVEPNQYYYAPSQLHVTVLSLFTATLDAAPLLARTPRYARAVRAALQGFEPIGISFEGVTVSASSVMLQGFLADDSLNQLRDRLRQQLQAAELGEGLDRRYRLETAHMTIARFRSGMTDPLRFAEALKQARKRDFGLSKVTRMTLVKNDWYMSSRVTRVVARYRLPEADQRRLV